MLPYFFLVFSILTVLFTLGLRLNVDPASNIIWLWLLSVFNSLFGGMALGTVLGVLLPSIKEINNSLPMVALPLTLLGGAFVSVRSLNWLLFVLSYLSPIRFTY